MYDETVTHLQSLDPRLQPYALEFVNAARSAGLPFVLISGRRRQAYNAEIGGAERSLHLYGLAFDGAMLGYTRDQVPFWIWQALGEWWESVGGRWGGRFRAPDVNHFDTGGVDV